MSASGGLRVGALLTARNILSDVIRYMAGPGPPWFLMWLLMFQAAYCFIRGGGGGSGTNQAKPTALAATDSAGFHASQRRPAFWKLAAGGVLLGGVQALCNVPTGITSLFVSMAFFTVFLKYVAS